jgi:hypothetical protein
LLLISWRRTETSKFRTHDTTARAHTPRLRTDGYDTRKPLKRQLALASPEKRRRPIDRTARVFIQTKTRETRKVNRIRKNDTYIIIVVVVAYAVPLQCASHSNSYCVTLGVRCHIRFSRNAVAAAFASRAGPLRRINFTSVENWIY